MESIQVQGYVNGEHQLSANVPGTIPPGPVTVWVTPIDSEADERGNFWAAGIAHEWAEELADARQDIYTLADGDAVDPS